MGTVNYSTSSDLGKLDGQIVLKYSKSSGTIELNPSQPTPIVMEVGAESGTKAEAQYELKGTISGKLPSKKWRMLYSNIGKDECHDFSDQHVTTFNDTEIAPNKMGLSWDVRKKGTIGLATTFFTPKGTDIRAVPVTGRNGKLIGIDQLMNADAVMLNYADSVGIADYDTLAGLFKMVDETKLCISTGSNDEVKMWWNPDYLKQIASQINAGEGYSCK
jgi:hypothetical protein